MHRLLVLTAVVLLSGCAQFYAQQGNVNAQIDTWVEQHRYDRALETIAALDPEHDQYQELNQRADVIESKRDTYIEQTLQEAARCEPEGDWAKAVAILDDALERLPNAPELQAQRAEYEERRLNSIDRSERAILLARGRFLLSTRASEEDLLKANPDGFFSQQRYRAFQQELQQVSRQLYAVGRQALYENRSTDAVAALTLSNQLSPNDLSQELLSSIQQAQREERTARRNEETAAAEQQWPVLETGFQQALRLNDLVGARRLVAEMEEIDPEAAQPYREQVQRRIDREAAALAERGQLLYSQGFLREALDVWREALQLKPDDPDLQANAQRAETFLENLDRWDD